MRVTDRFSRHRSLAADGASKCHKGDILPDSLSESNYPLQYLKGVGPARARALAMLGILKPG